jgi:hypothetical protein
VGVALACAGVAQANVPGTSETHLASQTPDGLIPNGPSTNPAISQDRKANSLLAYDSFATNILPGDVNGFRDVFVLHRAQPFDPAVQRATPWRAGNTELVSTGMGEPANGDSYLPDLDGDQFHNAHCVAFVSNASNLVPGDTNGKADGFVKDLTTGQITRVTVNSQGQQANGDTFNIQVDGACDRVAFTSDASNVAYTATPKKITVKQQLTSKQRRACRKRYKSKKVQRKRCLFRKKKVKAPGGAARTTAPPAGTKQVYVRILDASQPDNKYLAGLTFLASASSTGVAGNGNSYDVAFGDLGDGCPAHCGTTSGDAVAFTSEATNLAAGDGNGPTPDVYERTFAIPTQKAAQRRLGTPAYMQMKTRLVSVGGNGASDQPTMNDSGLYVGFRTAATNLVPGDTNGVTDVIRADMRKDPPELQRMSQTRAGVIADGASSEPSMARPGSPVHFVSEADNLSGIPATDKNCVADVFFWNIVSRNLAIESTDSDDAVSGNTRGNANTDPCPSIHTAPAQNPASSYYANYVTFEDSNPLLDLAVADRQFPGLRNDPDAAARRANSDPTLHQVYIHFSGP